MKFRSVLVLSMLMFLSVILVLGCGGGGGGSLNPTNPTNPTDPGEPTAQEKINQLLNTFETAFTTGNIVLLKTCLTDPCTFNDTESSLDAITEIETFELYTYANRQIQVTDSDRATVTSVNVSQESAAANYLDSYDYVLLEIVKASDTWKITSSSDLPFTPDSQDKTALEQLFTNLGEGMLSGKDLDKVSNCVNYPFYQYSHPTETVFNSQTDLQNYLWTDLSFDTFDIVVNDYYYIGTIDSEYIAAIEISLSYHGTTSDSYVHHGEGLLLDIILKKANNQWKIYKIKGVIFKSTP